MILAGKKVAVVQPFNWLDPYGNRFGFCRKVATKIKCRFDPYSAPYSTIAYDDSHLDSQFSIAVICKCGVDKSIADPFIFIP